MTEKHLPQAPVGEFLLFQSDNGRAARVECRFQSDTLWLTQAGAISKKMANNKAQAAYNLFAEPQRRLKAAEGEKDITELLQWKVDPKDKGV